MKKKFFALYTGILTACLSCISLCASAYTADDVANKAREAGWPENLIQTGYNQWASGEYTQSQLDEAYYSILEYNEQNEEFIYNALGIDPDEAKAKLEKKEKEKKEKEEQASQPSPEPEVQPGTPAETPTETSSSFISDSEFISMSLEEKQAYINSLSEDDKLEFIASLSTEARNSIIKQLPTEDKVSIMQKYIDTASTMGMHVTVDEITDKDISVTVRNQEGIVIDKAEVGIVIDETGLSHTKPLLFAGIGTLIASAGFASLYWYIKHTEQD